MIEAMLASVGLYGGYYGGAFGNLLLQWQQLGVFSYMLPFLLIFSLVYGILTQVNLFKGNRTVNAILALTIGLLSLQFDFVPRFFSEIFPRLGVGLAIILVLIVLTSLFMNPKNKGQVYLLYAVAAIIVIVIVVQSAGATGFTYGSWLPWLGYHWQEIFALVAILVVVGVVIGSSMPRKQGVDVSEVPLVKALMGN